jgi:hypothetical protein
MDVARLALAFFGFLGISAHSFLTLLRSDPATTATVSHPTFEELSKPNPLLEALRRPQATNPTFEELGKPNTAPLQQRDPTPTSEESSKPNAVPEALHQPQPILGTISDKVPIAEPNSVFGTISAIGPQITERSATDDILNVTVHRAQNTLNN